MVWGVIKRKVAERNITFKLTEVDKETKEQFREMTPEVFQAYVSHAIEDEEKYRQINLESE